MAQDTQALITKYSAKAAGVYREFIDATSEAATSTEQNVVVVGQFENGPFMRPVYCKDASVAHNIFGKRNTKLEAKGCYGMLLAEHVLEAGPIWILNLKNIDQYKETLQVKQLAVNSKEQDNLINEAIATVYDTSKFWKVDPMYGVYGEGQVLSFASVLQDKVTVVVEKYDDDDYMYTIGETKKYNESFSNDDVNDDDFVNDYLVRVHVFKTDLANAKLSVNNAIVNGRLNINLIDDIKDDVNAKWFATYTGTIGDIIDRNGNNLNIAVKMNADTNASGVHVAINRDAIAANGVDLLFRDSLVFAKSGAALPSVTDGSRIGYSITPVASKVCMYVAANDNSVAYMYANIATGDIDVTVGDVIANEAKSVRVLSKRLVDYTYKFYKNELLGTVQYPIKPDGKPFDVDATGVPVYPVDSPKAGQPVEQNGSNTKQIVWYAYLQSIKLGEWSFNSGSTTEIESDGRAGIELAYMLNGIEGSVFVEASSDANKLTQVAKFNSLVKLLSEATGCAFTPSIDSNESVVFKISTTYVASSVQELRLLRMNLMQNDASASINATSASDDKSVASYTISIVTRNLAVSNAGNFYTVAEVGQPSGTRIDMAAVDEAYGIQTAVYELKLTEPLTSSVESGQTTELSNGGTYGEAMSTAINNSNVTVTPYEFLRLGKWRSLETSAAINVIQGIVSLESHYVNGTAARQKAVLDRLNDNGIMTSFSDPTIFRCRYMVDTFKTYIEPSAKQQFCILANAAKRFPVIGSCPFYHELRTSKNPDFRNAIGEFDMSYVAKGYNPDKPSTNSFSWPSSDIAAYYWPYMSVMYNDGFSDKVVPSAGAITKLYYSKLISATRKVYDIVAGDGWSVSAAGITGPEFETGPDDRAAMEQMGSNVLQRINGSLQIRSNKTAYQTVISAFNYPETLEKCFYISDYVEPTLSGKLFKYNNADARLQVKQKADSGCDIMVADGVISSYENKCDLDNNPIDVRKRGIIVLDTVLYNEYGIRIAVHRTTIKDSEV